MESHPNLYDYGHFGDHTEAQNGLVYSGFTSDNGAGGWDFESFRSEVSLDVSFSQPVSVFESENGSTQSSFSTDFTDSQSSSHTAFGDTENHHFDSTWIPSSDAIAMSTNSYQEINNGDRITKSPRASVFVPLYHQPPQMISPSSIISQQLGIGSVNPSVYTPQQGFEPLLGRESRENLLHNNSLYVLPTPLHITLAPKLTLSQDQR